ncbi:hypothetical protein [Pontibaca salina]|uniref:Uncharacterized protein n=1 Tax=Pontibaca salina TaxID=2795731 RepID=A0A934HST3_9RHOB|nr:hypothetical protein [Pontibaca salina]MBI6630757.1 hypothetical protein [Pontibaca salina]
MAKITRVVAKKSRQNTELLDLIPRLRLLPGEDSIAFEDLRAALLLEFAPATPYQTALAENLVALEWEIHRYRRMRDHLIRTKYRAVARSTRMPGGFIGSKAEEWEEAKEFANALLGPDTEKSAAALDWLAEQNIDPAELAATAYSDAQDALAPLERMLTDLETRRRLLRKDYDQLRASSAAVIEDATLLEDE